MFKSAERVREISTTTGTGTYMLGGAPTGYQPVSSIGANSYGPFYVTDGTNWEALISQYLAGPDRLTRDAVMASSNAGAAVNWGAGTRTVRGGWPAWLALPSTQTIATGGGAGTTVLTQVQQRARRLVFTGALTGNRVIEVDATQWDWIVYNNTSGAFTLTLRVTGQTGVTIPQGASRACFCDGTDVRKDSEIDDGTAMLFVQTSAPTGWTKSSTHNNKALRIVSGTAGSGGSIAFTTVFGAGIVTGATTITTATSAAHDHAGTATIKVADNAGAQLGLNGGSATNTAGGNTNEALTVVGLTSVGGGGSHTHTENLDLQYVDVIIATKG